ncbi:MAG: MarC family protein, partial [Thiolinea sp.]
MGELNWQELLDLNEYLKLFIGLFAMADPISAAAIFMSITAGFSSHERRQMAFFSALTMLITLSVFLFSGMLILDTFGISLGAFTAMGGVVLFLAGLDLLKSDGEIPDSLKASGKTTPLSLAIIPIAIPMLAGPGTLSMLIVFSAQHDSPTHQIVLLIVCICLALST